VPVNQSAWLVDVGYVVKASEGIFRLDYVQAHRIVGERCGPARAFLFNGYDEAYGIPAGLQAFYEAMRQYGMVVRLQPMESGLQANRQRGVDVDLAAHLVWQAGLAEVETLVVTTGDQDLIPAVEVARERLGKRVVLFTYRRSVSHELIDRADEWWCFEDEQARLAR
jgi:uncharacterized LabA/DUF88 family protein